MGQVDSVISTHTPKIFVICNQPDTAPVWGYILRKDGLVVVLEKSLDKMTDHWSSELPELTVIDLDITQDPVELCKKVRSISVAPILLMLPSYNETLILSAYQAGVDDVVIKPVSPPIFLAKIKAWLKRSWNIPDERLGQVQSGGYLLDSMKRCLISPQKNEIKLTSLEFRLLHILMSQAGQEIDSDDLINSIWGAYGNGDNILLKNVVYRLRRKVEADPSHPTIIQTWPGGYSFMG